MQTKESAVNTVVFREDLSSLRATLSWHVEIDDLETGYARPTGMDMLPPLTDAYADLVLTITDQEGRPVSGFPVSATAGPHHLVDASWRDKETLLSRFPSKARERLRAKIDEGRVRLIGRVRPGSATTGPNGKAEFRYQAIHVCGDKTQPAADKVILRAPGAEPEEHSVILKIGMPGLAALTEDPANGVSLKPGIVGRHVHPRLADVITQIGRAWKNLPRPPGYPNYPNSITITDASLKWGGLNPPHLTHRFGGTMDLRPISTDGKPTNVDAPNYHRRGSEALVQILSKSGTTQIRFADNIPGVTHVDASHSDHLHVSWLSDPVEPWLIPGTALGSLSGT